MGAEYFNNSFVFESTTTEHNVRLLWIRFLRGWVSCCDRYAHIFISVILLVGMGDVRKYYGTDDLFVSRQQWRLSNYCVCLRFKHFDRRYREIAGPALNKPSPFHYLTCTETFSLKGSSNTADIKYMETTPFQNVVKSLNGLKCSCAPL